MRKFISALVGVVLAITLTGCSGGTQASAPQSPKEVLKNERIQELSGDPNKFKGYPAELSGRIFMPPESKDGVTYFQMWADPKNNTGNTVVYLKGTSENIKNGAFVKVKGTVDGKFEGKNAFGGVVTAISLVANVVEKVNPIEILAPTKKTVEVNKIINQKGYTIALQRVEFSDSETRVYLSVTNETDGKISFYSYSAKAVQNGKQFETEYGNENYPKLQSDILPGVKTEGVLVFKPLDASAGNAQFIFDGSFGNFTIRFNPVKFDISWK
ncbi:DUF5067 domain-containing protein [Heliobacterium undosum]|uniref:DUF5067 domain-containing protein n=1 Tax=Heliomicrobium undosum TaxID=121734 RepID=A0A845LE78_9FIRM|nr:DUF5067 domain-containing protein [Heliomicrobium undosum]MZP31221.1 DUF5067 domain-containing protein [Heliomicrobium undosum]